MEKIYVGLIGHGTVGSGTSKVLLGNADIISDRTGCQVILKTVLEKNVEQTKVKLPDVVRVTSNPDELFEDREIKIVIELIGGIEPAKSFISRAIENGKSVVTANKELMASHGKELLKKASEKGVDLYFEASVGGGIPVIHPLRESLAADRVLKIMGILNGTTNYILTQMEKGYEFDDALAQAQEAGFAEKDPSADIEGRDPAAKIAILASIAFNSRVVQNDVFTEGISKISSSDIKYARDLGYAIKLIALAKEEEDGLDVRVHPTMIPLSHPLAGVSKNYNAIFLEGEAVGELMFFGQGAGSLPTASAVVGDVVDIARNIKSNSTGAIGCTCFYEKKIVRVNEISTNYYMRMLVKDRPGVLAKIATAFGDNQVSLSKVLQTSTVEDKAEVIFVTHLSKESNVQKAIDEIKKLDVIKEVSSVIRVEVSGT
jgi:homoserine dehydrogenase